jgi:amino acid transporter
MVAWNLWLFAILNTVGDRLQSTQYVSYIIGPEGEWLNSSPAVHRRYKYLIIGALIVITVVGLGVGKWVHKAGGVLMLAIFGTILILPLLNLANGSLKEYHPFQTELPIISLMTLNLLGKMGFGALGGFEYVAIHAGEARDPVRTIGRSVVVAAPIIALMFILGTSSVLSLIPQDQIDLIAPIPQVLSVGFGPLGFVAGIASLTIMAILSIRLAQSSVMFAGNTRLPMVAGWDNLLPRWFTKLHDKYKTPVNSILFVGAVTLFMGIVGLIGVGKQEAFQILWNASGVFYALTYLVMFAIPIIGLRSSGVKVPAVAKGRVAQRIYDDAALRRPFDRADSKGRKPVGVCDEDRWFDRYYESDRSRCVFFRAATKRKSGLTPFFLHASLRAVD